jgi:hypothetical protein
VTGNDIPSNIYLTQSIVVFHGKICTSLKYNVSDLFNNIIFDDKLIS